MQKLTPAAVFVIKRGIVSVDDADLPLLVRLQQILRRLRPQWRSHKPASAYRTGRDD